MKIGLYEMLGIAFFMVLPGVWVWFDARRYRFRAIPGLLVGITGVIGLVLYLTVTRLLLRNRVARV